MRRTGSTSAPLVADATAPLPVARHVRGRSQDEVLALLPRLFNLCRAAQGAGIAAALGRTVDASGIAAECLRDHLMKFHVTWPRLFGRAPAPLPDGWAEGGRGLLAGLFGTDRAPRAPQDFAAFLDSGRALAGPLRMIRDSFAPREAAAEGLVPVTFATLWNTAPVENSVAGRHAPHPVMDHVARTYGRGPLWRATARLYDIEAAALGQLPVIAAEDGGAMVPAARGAYGVRVTVAEGVVTDLTRVTPTDALLAEGGILDRTLGSLPADKAGLGPLLLDILDPCSPVRLREAADA